MKKFVIALSLMMAVAAVFAGSSRVEYYYLGDLSNPEEKMKVNLFTQNRRAIDKSFFKGFTKRYADDLRQKGNVVSDVNVVILRLYKTGTEDRYVDWIVSYEMYAISTPAGVYFYVWVAKPDPSGAKNENGTTKEIWERSQTFYNVEEATEWCTQEALKYDSADAAEQILAHTIK